MHGSRSVDSGVLASRSGPVRCDPRFQRFPRRPAGCEGGVETCLHGVLTPPTANRFLPLNSAISHRGQAKNRSLKIALFSTRVEIQNSTQPTPKPKSGQSPIPTNRRLSPLPFPCLEHQDDRTGRCQHGDYCAPRRGASGGIFFERSGLHLAGQLPAVDNCRSSSVGYRRQDELT